MSVARSGRDWSFDKDGHVTFFSCSGRKINSETWEVSDRKGAEFREINPDLVSLEILKLIEGCRYVVLDVTVKSPQAVRLFLEGVITLESLQVAEETPEDITLKIKLAGVEHELVIARLAAMPVYIHYT